MPCGRRVESGVSVPWGDVVGEDVAEGEDAAVTGENVRTNGEGRTAARGDERRAQLVGSEGD